VYQGNQLFSKSKYAIGLEDAQGKVIGENL
jgi:hypothetical protein